MSIETQRRETFIALLVSYHYPTDPNAHADSTGEEDALAQLAEDTDDPIRRFAIVYVDADGPTSILARCDTLDAAKAAAVKHINDDIFAEAPLKIVDLDTGQVFRPAWETLEWREADDAS